MIEKYEHHGCTVFVQSHLKGKHREHCLCFKCRGFNPGVPEKNCKTANMNYALCLLTNLVTPVYECPNFVEKE